jgi:hypothetical protein
MGTRCVSTAAKIGRFGREKGYDRGIRFWSFLKKSLFDCCGLIDGLRYGAIPHFTCRESLRYNLLREPNLYGNNTE